MLSRQFIKSANFYTVRWFTRIGGTMREANKVEKTAAEKSYDETKKILSKTKKYFTQHLQM